MAIAMIGPDGVEWTAVYGEPATKNTLYNIASLTKPLTAETLLSALRDERIALDRPVAEVFIDDDLTNDPRAEKLTLRHLLSHRSEFPETWRRMMKHEKLQIAWEPGTRARYSGENFELAARYAESSTDKTIDELARETLFAQGGISDIWFRPNPIPKGRVAMVRGEDGSWRLA